jgi:hypothetical protein
MNRRTAMGALCGVVAFGGLIAMIGPATAQSAAQAETQILRWAFDDCRDAGIDCAVAVTDSSGKQNHGTVHTAAGGGVEIVDGEVGLAIRLNNAALQLDSSPNYADFSPGDRTFRFGAEVRVDSRVQGGANVIQRGFFDTPQWKVQLDEGRNLCMINGAQGRTTAQLDQEIPIGDGKFYRLDCKVTPDTVRFRVYDVATGEELRDKAVPNVSGAVTFPDAGHKVQVGGKVMPDGSLDDLFTGIIDKAYYVIG